MSEAWRTLTGYAHRHHGIVSRRAARDLGVADDRIDAFIRSGRLERRATGVYAVSGSPRSWHQRVMAVTTYASGWASHRTAAALWRLDGFRRGQVEVLTFHGLRRMQRGWRIHETRRLSGADLAEVDRIPCTAVPRMILDLAAVAHPTQVAGALDHACRRWPGMLDVVVQRFLELGGRGRPGSRLMRTLLDERLGTGRFTQSGFESLALKLVLAAGLPKPVPQYPVRDGRFAAYIDLAWPPPVQLGLECDSLAWHTGKRAHEWDRQRRRKLKALGWDMIEVTYDDVTRRPAATAEELRTLYDARCALLRSGSD